MIICFLLFIVYVSIWVACPLALVKTSNTVTDESSSEGIFVLCLVLKRVQGIGFVVVTSMCSSEKCVVLQIIENFGNRDSNKRFLSLQEEEGWRVAGVSSFRGSTRPRVCEPPGSSQGCKETLTAWEYPHPCLRQRRGQGVRVCPLAGMQTLSPEAPLP